jgi:hypothetical protein
MTAAGQPASALPIVQLVKQGWAAFARAPWPFIGFTLVGGLLNLLTQSIQEHASSAIEANTGLPILWILIFLGGLALNVIASLWMNLGLFRGAWKAVGGAAPKFADFLRWDSRAMTRLFWMAFLLLGINLLVILVAGLAGALLSLIRVELMALPLVAGVLVLIYVAITQMFHLPLVVARGEKPLAAFQAGRHGIDPQFWRLLGFAILMVLITLGGLLLFGVGILVAAPVVVCSLVAAYQHLFDKEDRTGFLLEG